MELTTLIGLLGTALTLALCVWVTFLMGGDILNQSFLYRSMWVSFLSGICMYLWGVQLVRLYFKNECRRMIDAVEKMVIEANDVADYELKKLTRDQIDDSDDDLPEQLDD